MQLQQIKMGIYMLGLSVSLAACAAPAPAQVQVQETEMTEALEAERAEEPEYVRECILIGEKAQLLEASQRDIILRYEKQYFESLASLETAEIEDLFSENAGMQPIFHEKAWEYAIGLRAIQQSDLHLEGYRCELTVDDIIENEDGSITVMLTEHSIQNFAQHPQVDSEFFRVGHEFILVQEGGNWRIQEHWQRDGVYRNMMNGYSRGELLQIPEAESFFETRKEALLELAQEQKKIREDTAMTQTAEQREAAHKYDREAAAAYAVEWIGKRNEEWSDFTARGGNCQNYVSQSLAAGGIPMDISGEAVWKWYFEGINDSAEAYGNSTSWINVEAFYQYASSNEGYGLVAIPDAPYNEGETGDIIRMGFPGVWNHAVIIAEVIRDDKGEVIDYLVHSNTSDLRFFPVSAYSIPCQSLIKIAGWNEE